MYRWFNHITGVSDAQSEPELIIEKDETLWCTPRGQVCELNSQPIYSFTKAKSQALAKKRRSNLSTPELKRRIVKALRLRKLPGLRANKAIHSLTAFLGVTMVSRTNKEFAPLFGPQQIIQMPEPAVGLFSAAGIKVIFLLCQNDNRFRCHRGKEIRMIQSKGQRLRWALLGIGGKLVFQITAERRHETARSSHCPAAFNAAQPGRHCASTRVPGDADMLRIDFFTR
ncbi:hypothetical protein ES703_124579 [subsurface metagenome]